VCACCNAVAGCAVPELPFVLADHAGSGGQHIQVRAEGGRPPELGRVQSAAGGRPGAGGRRQRKHLLPPGLQVQHVVGRRHRKRRVQRLAQVKNMVLCLGK